MQKLKIKLALEKSNIKPKQDAITLKSTNKLTYPKNLKTPSNKSEIPLKALISGIGDMSKIKKLITREYNPVNITSTTPESFNEFFITKYRSKNYHNVGYSEF